MLNKLKSATTHHPKLIKKLLQNELLGIAHSFASDGTTMYYYDEGANWTMWNRPHVSCNFVVIINWFSVIFRLAESKISSIHEFLVIIYDHIMGLGRYHKHINIVCDRYFKDTLKDQTWIGRGIGTQIDFDWQWHTFSLWCAIWLLW